jgi:hypothetical protein
VQGHHKLVSYFFDELGLKSLKDLKVESLIDDMHFIVAPIFKRDTETVKIILE